MFREWSLRWPDQLRSKLIDKLNELDPDFATKLNETLEAQLESIDESSSAINGNGVNEESNVPTTNGFDGCVVNGEKENLAGEENSLTNGITALSVNENN